MLVWFGCAFPCLPPVGREVTPEERERAEALFVGGDGRGVVAANVVQDQTRVTGGPAGRVPLQLTSVNFESLSLGGAMSALAGSGDTYQPQIPPQIPTGLNGLLSRCLCCF